MTPVLLSIFLHSVMKMAKEMVLTPSVKESKSESRGGAEQSPSASRQRAAITSPCAIL